MNSSDAVTDLDASRRECRHWENVTEWKFVPYKQPKFIKFPKNWRMKKKRPLGTMLLCDNQTPTVRLLYIQNQNNNMK
jgi:hypothetical protein